MPLQATRLGLALFLFAAAAAACATEPGPGADPLPSWNEGETKSAIIRFVQRTTTTDSPDYVRPEARVATFDNDGTLWAEQPLYFQGIFALDRLRSLADQHPEWRTTEPYKSALAGDLPGLSATGMEGVEKIIVATHANLTAEEFDTAVRAWLARAKHPKTGKPYTQMVYQPMLELLRYLKANEFKTYIVSGGGIDFMRVFAEEVYGIPPEQVIGTTIDARFEMRDGVPTIVKNGQLVLVDDKAGKPVGIYRHIGRRPVFAAGNSDGDFEMLEYATVPRNAQDVAPRMGLIVHHTDAQREWAYDRASQVGRLDKALEAAPQRGWIVVDMQRDWRQIYPAATGD